MNKLKPCPFCGGEAELVDGWVLKWVRCKKCSAQLVPFEEPYAEKSIALWNRRVERSEDE